MRSTARVETQIYAVGLDVGGAALEVGQRGFSSTFSNQMRHLGTWVPRTARPTLRLAADLVARVVTREVPDHERVAVGVAVPAWFGLPERRELVGLLDPGGRYELSCCTTSLAAALMSSLTQARPLQAEHVLCIDLGVGWAGSVVAIGSDEVVEVASAGLAPLEGVRPPGRVDVTAALDALLAAAGAAGVHEIGRVLVVGATGWPVDAVDEVVADLRRRSSAAVVEVATDRGVVSEGAAVFADVRGGLRLLGVDVPGGGELAVHGSCTRSIGVLVDDGEGSGLAVQAVVPAHVRLPAERSETFDLGPDDGSEIYLDVFEQRTIGSSADPADHRVVLSGRLRAGERHRDELTVTFTVGAAGLLELGPPGRWTTTWYPGQVDIVAVPPPPAIAPAAGAAAARAADRVADAGVGARSDVAVPDTLHGLQAELPLAVDRAAAGIELTTALLAFERQLSREIGELVAVRSVHALLGCRGAHTPDQLFVAARQLEQTLGSRDDELGAACRDALHAARRALTVPGGALHYGGTPTEIAAELARVIEHLAVVVGEVSPAERRRLVHDGELLGLDHDQAVAMVSGLVAQAPVPLRPPAPRPLGTGDADLVRHRDVAVLDPVTGRFVLRRDVDDADLVGAVCVRVLRELD